jgi:hypothetical protein
MRTLRNLAGVAFLVAVLFSQQARVDAFMNCGSQSYCTWYGYMYYEYYCQYAYEETDCFYMQWETEAQCDSVSNGFGYLNFSCIGHYDWDGPPVQGSFSCSWIAQNEPCQP